MKKLLLALVLMAPMLVYTGCGGDDDEPNIPDQILNVGQTYSIPTDGTWRSENDFIASVNNKTVKGIRAGNTVISNGGKSFKVQVNPTITLFKDPCLDFGASKQTVRNFMSWITEGTEENNSLTFAERVDGSVVGYHYTFENGKLDSSMVLAQYTIANTDKFADYLSQRFVPVGEEDGVIGMISPDKKVGVGVTVKSYSGGLMYVIAYFPFNGSKTRSIDTNKIRNLIESLPGDIIREKVIEILN